MITHEICLEINWAKTPEAQRLAYLQSVENDMAKQQCRKFRPIIISNDLPNGGEYVEDNDLGSYIKISRYDFEDNGFQCLNSIYHEGRHAYQDDVINNRIVVYEPLKEIWLQNDPAECYMTYANAVSQNKYFYYYFQPQEVDAYEFARMQMNKLNEELKLDNMFQKYDWDEQTNKRKALENARAYLDKKLSEKSIIAEVQKQVEARYREKILGISRNNGKSEIITITQNMNVKTHNMPYKPSIEESKQSIEEMCNKRQTNLEGAYTSNEENDYSYFNAISY